MKQSKIKDEKWLQSEEKVVTKVTKSRVQYRKLEVRTYLTEKQVNGVLQTYSNRILSACYIKHDKDDCEPHIHLLIRPLTPTRVSQIERWFEGFKDDEGRHINYHVDGVNDENEFLRYLLHRTEKSKEDGKHPYCEKDIKVPYGNFKYLIERTDCKDSSYGILEDMLIGVSVREMVRIYGRDFVYHFHQYSDIADTIKSDYGCRESRLYAFTESSKMQQDVFTAYNADEDKKN